MSIYDPDYIVNNQNNDQNNNNIENFNIINYMIDNENNKDSIHIADNYINMNNNDINNTAIQFIKNGGFDNIEYNDTSFNIIIDDETIYSGGVETNYWLNKRAIKIDDIISRLKHQDEQEEYKRLIKKMYPFIILNDVENITMIYDKSIYQYIMDNSTIAGALDAQLNILIKKLSKFEDNIIKKVTEHCTKTSYISIPEESVLEKIINESKINYKQMKGFPANIAIYSINTDIIYYPDVLRNIINEIIDYINAIKIANKKQKIDYVNGINIKAPYEENSHIIFNNPINYKNMLNKLFEREVYISSYIKKVEEYHGYIIKQINNILNVLKSIN